MSDRSLRILYVTGGFPYPLTSGYLRHYHFIRGLAERGHHVHLLSMARRSTTADDVEEMRRFADQVETFVPEPGGLLREGAGLAATPRHISALAARARALAAAGDVDVVLLSGKETHPVITSIASTPVAVDMCDATTSRIRRTARHASLPRRLWLTVEARRLEAIEGRLVRLAGATAYASARDREDTVGPDGGGIILPNGVDTGYWQRRAPRLGPRDVVLTGAMNYRPNVDAALQLIDEVRPRLLREIPDARIVVVGRDPVRALRDRHDGAGVVVTGAVDDVRPYLDRAAAFAAPIRFGAGIQNKVLEALAMEVPTAASPIAAEGLRLEDGTTPPITMAPTAAEMADALVGLVRSAREDGRPHAAGREYVRTHFTWDASIDRLERLLVGAMEGT